MEEPSDDYDHLMFVNMGAAEKFGLISTNRSFIKEKGFNHLDDFFRKTIENKRVEGTVPTPKANCHNSCVRILRQHSSACFEKG